MHRQACDSLGNCMNIQSCTLSQKKTLSTLLRVCDAFQKGSMSGYTQLDRKFACVHSHQTQLIVVHQMTNITKKENTEWLFNSSSIFHAIGSSRLRRDWNGRMMLIEEETNVYGETKKARRHSFGARRRCLHHGLGTGLGLMILFGPLTKTVHQLESTSTQEHGLNQMIRTTTVLYHLRGSTTLGEMGQNLPRSHGGVSLSQLPELVLVHQETPFQSGRGHVRMRVDRE
mmetsp:Transcript_23547/g.58952  ORF Transcript_23547/g.58952 Transcript_23547/m.58952 type:complete len:229 (+) Transcript_23547:889-1575(+)